MMIPDLSTSDPNAYSPTFIAKKWLGMSCLNVSLSSTMETLLSACITTLYKLYVYPTIVIVLVITVSPFKAMRAIDVRFKPADVGTVSGHKNILPVNTRIEVVLYTRPVMAE
jgi:hypothetical protein